MLESSQERQQCAAALGELTHYVTTQRESKQKIVLLLSNWITLALVAVSIALLSLGNEALYTVPAPDSTYRNANRLSLTKISATVTK